MDAIKRDLKTIQEIQKQMDEERHKQDLMSAQIKDLETQLKRSKQTQEQLTSTRETLTTTIQEHLEALDELKSMICDVIQSPASSSYSAASPSKRKAESLPSEADLDSSPKPQKRFHDGDARGSTSLSGRDMEFSLPVAADHTTRMLPPPPPPPPPPPLPTFRLTEEYKSREEPSSSSLSSSSSFAASSPRTFSKSCPACGKGFSDENSTKLHYDRLHVPEAERPHGCTSCHRRFVRKCELLDHVCSQEYPCPYPRCRYSFPSAVMLKHHMNSKLMGELHNAYSCSLCAEFSLEPLQIHPSVETLKICASCHKGLLELEPRAVHADGYHNLCTICGQGSQVLLCCEDQTTGQCPHAFCDPCLTLMGTSLEQLKTLSHWSCFVCCPLHNAIRCRRLKDVAVLLDRVSSPEELLLKDAQNMTPVELALQQADADILQLFQDRKISLSL